MICVPFWASCTVMTRVLWPDQILSWPAFTNLHKSFWDNSWDPATSWIIFDCRWWSYLAGGKAGWAAGRAKTTLAAAAATSWLMVWFGNGRATVGTQVLGPHSTHSGSVREPVLYPSTGYRVPPLYNRLWMTDLWRAGRGQEWPLILANRFGHTNSGGDHKERHSSKVVHTLSTPWEDLVLGNVDDVIMQTVASLQKEMRF